MTNKEIIQNIHPDFYNSRAHVRRRVLLGFEVEEAMSAARKDEAISFGEWLKEMGMMEYEGMWMQSAGNSTKWTNKQLYQLFKKDK